MKKLNLFFSLTLFSFVAYAQNSVLDEDTFIKKALSVIYFTDVDGYQNHKKENTLSEYILKRDFGDFLDLPILNIEKKFLLDPKSADQFLRDKTVLIRECSVEKKGHGFVCRQIGSLELPIHPKVSLLNASRNEQLLDVNSIFLGPMLCKYQKLDADGPSFSNCVFIKDILDTESTKKEMLSIIFKDENLQKILKTAYSNINRLDRLMLTGDNWPYYFYTTKHKLVLDAAEQLGFDLPILR